MRVYLSASTEQTEASKVLYKKILKILESFDMENSNPYSAAIIQGDVKQPMPDDLYDIALRSVMNSDLLMIDIADKSISLGILIEFARNNNIPTLCICNEDDQAKIPRILIHRKKSHLFSLLIYNSKNMEKLLGDFFEKFKKNKVKFNVFITPEIDSYMKWAAKRKKLPSKSDFFRDLIESQIKNDPEYNKG